jgi:hypothetical protein
MKLSINIEQQMSQDFTSFLTDVDQSIALNERLRLIKEYFIEIIREQFKIMNISDDNTIAYAAFDHMFFGGESRSFKRSISQPRLAEFKREIEKMYTYIVIHHRELDVANAIVGELKPRIIALVQALVQ